MDVQWGMGMTGAFLPSVQNTRPLYDMLGRAFARLRVCPFRSVSGLMEWHNYVWFAPHVHEKTNRLHGQTISQIFLGLGVEVRM